MSWFRFGIKWGWTVVLVLILLGLLDLYTFGFFLRDPGYYVVARRSDTPSQVIEALDQIGQSRDRTREEIQRLLDRYRVNSRDEKREVAERRQWKRALKKTRDLLEQKQEAPPP